jgi:hypothetical protein
VSLSRIEFKSRPSRFGIGIRPTYFGGTDSPERFGGGLSPDDFTVFSTVVVVVPPGVLTFSVVVLFSVRSQPTNIGPLNRSNAAPSVNMRLMIVFLQKGLLSSNSAQAWNSQPAALKKTTDRPNTSIGYTQRFAKNPRGSRRRSPSQR